MNKNNPQNPEKILIIEDEEKLARMIELELTYEGYQVQKVFDGREGLRYVLEAETEPFDLVLLDVMLPSLNGIEVLRRLRTQSKVPVILLTARDTLADKVSGLDLGADDYITKPFEIEELLARIRVALRKTRQNKVSSTVLSCGLLSINLEKHQAYMGADAIDLTKREFDLLHYFLQNQGLVISRESLLNHVWDYDFNGSTNAVDVYVRYLRAKIEEPYQRKFIHTIRGVGYVLKNE